MSFEPVMPPYNGSDPNASFLSSSCLDFLLIEIVPMAYRVTNELEASATEDTTTTDNTKEQKGNGDKTNTSIGKVMDEDEERDAVFYRLETLGYRVGQGLVERYVYLCLVCAWVLGRNVWLVGWMDDGRVGYWWTKTTRGQVWKRTG